MTEVRRALAGLHRLPGQMVCARRNESGARTAPELLPPTSRSKGGVDRAAVLAVFGRERIGYDGYQHARLAQVALKCALDLLGKATPIGSGPSRLVDGQPPHEVVVGTVEPQCWAAHVHADEGWAASTFAAARSRRWPLALASLSVGTEAIASVNWSTTYSSTSPLDELSVPKGCANQTDRHLGDTPHGRARHAEQSKQFERSVADPSLRREVLTSRCHRYGPLPSSSLTYRIRLGVCTRDPICYTGIQS